MLLLKPDELFLYMHMDDPILVPNLAESFVMLLLLGTPLWFLIYTRLIMLHAAELNLSIQSA